MAGRGLLARVVVRLCAWLLSWFGYAVLDAYCLMDCFEAYRNEWHIPSKEMWRKLHDCVYQCEE